MLFTWEELLIKGLLSLTACGEELTVWGVASTWEELVLGTRVRLLPAWGELALAAWGKH